MTLEWPPERFFWSVVEVPDWKRTGVLPAGLHPLFEDDVPVPNDELHAICTPIGNGRVLVCAVGRNELKSVGPEAVSLIPAALPPCVDADVDLAALNLLVGEFEPPSQRRARQHTHFAAAATLMLCCLLIAIGFARRAEQHRFQATQAREATAALIAEVAPRARPETLGFELAALRRSSEVGQRIRPPVDASLALVDLLRSWPAEGGSSRPQSIAVSGNSISVSVLVEDDPAGFLEAVKAPPGWKMDQPRLNSVDKTTRLALQFRPAEGATP